MLTIAQQGSFKRFFYKYWSLLVYILVTSLTQAYYQGDTYQYTGSVYKFERGIYDNFTEFSHILWRPIIYFIHQIITSLPNNLFSDDPRTQINTAAFILTWTAGFTAIIFLIKALTLLKIQNYVIHFTVFFLIFSNAFLNFSQGGAAYVPSFMLLLMGIYYLLSQEKPERRNVNILRAGLSIGFSVTLWIPCVFSLAGIFLFPCIFYGFTKPRLQRVFLTMLISGGTILSTFAICIWAMGFEPIQAIKDWNAVSHGVVQDIAGANRVFFGVPKTFIIMISDGIIMKRFLLHDPYAPVSLIELLSSSVWKLMLFYSVLVSLLVLLFSNRDHYKAAISFLAGSLLMLLFATTYDGAANERYFPILPFFLITIAYALNIREKSTRRSLFRLSIFGFFISFAIINFAELSSGNITSRRLKAKNELEQLLPVLRSGDAIVAIPSDNIAIFNYEVHDKEYDILPTFQSVNLVELNSSTSPHWQKTLSNKIWSVWNSGSEVWMSTRFLADIPKPDWGWVELQDVRVKWKDIIDFTRMLECDPPLQQDKESFVHIQRTERNKQIFDSIIMHR